MTTPTTNEDAELDQILTNLGAYKLNNGEIMGGVDFSVEEHYAMYPELREAKSALTHYIARKTVERAIEELEQYSKQCGMLRMEPSTRGLKDRIERLKAQLHKLDGEQEGQPHE